MKLLVIGNGSVGINKEANAFYIPQNAGVFVKELQEKIEVHYLDLGSNYQTNNNLLDYDLNKNNIEFSVFGNKKNPLSFLKLARLILKMDYIYAFYPGSFSKVVALLSIVLNKPYGLYVRGKYYNEDKLDRFVLNKTKFILTISPSFVTDLRNFCSKTEIIRPMIDIELKDLNRNRDYSMPEKWNLLFVGRVEKRKGIYDLIEIANNLKINKINFEMNIVGGGDLFDEINNNIIELGLHKEVILQGLVSKQDKLKALYNEANAFVFTSHDEGFPRVLYEAMASGLPIFTTFVGGVSGRMKHEGNCIEIPVKNAEKASEILIDYLGNRKILETVGKKGQATMLEIIDSELLSHSELLVKHVTRN